MKQKVRILHIIDTLGSGGAEHLLVNYVNELNDFDNIILYFHGPHDLLPLIRNAKVICLEKSEKKNFFKIIKMIKQIIITNHIDIVHSHCYWSHIITRLATPYNRKLINHYHFAVYETMKNSLGTQRRIFLDKLTYNKRMYVVAVSKYVEDILRNRCNYTQRIQTITNFIGDEFYTVSNEKAKWQVGTTLKLVAVGSLKKEKNYALLIEAFKQLKNEPVSVDIYGYGGMANILQKELKQHNIQNISLKGKATEIQNILPGYDAYIMCSFSEACPLSPIEALGCHLPLILSDIPSLQEIAANNALFFKSNNVQSLVDLVKEILKGQKDLITPQKITLKNYSKNIFLDKLQQLYNC